MRVILINGSPREDGCTYTGLRIVKEQLEKNGVEGTIYHVGAKPVSGCVACGYCVGAGKCAIGDDLVNTIAEDFLGADGIVLGSPVHYASASGAAASFFDRLFFSIARRPDAPRLKFGAAVVSCRRGGASAAFDQLNKYFSISQMPIVSSCYWNQIHGNEPEEVLADLEGVNTLQVLANNMAYLIKVKTAAGLPLPEQPPMVMTNFIR